MIGFTWHTIAFVFGLIAFAPMRPGDLASHPAPSADYPTAVARVAAVQQAEDSVVAPGGGSILLTHGSRTPRVFVLFHGLTDSPRQFDPFARELYDRGDNVFVPRIPHHAERAGNIRTMSRLTARELRDLGDFAVDVAAGLGDSVIVVGLSAGGDVAAWTAQFRKEVKRAVLIAPALAPTKVPALLQGAVTRTVLRIPNVHRASVRSADEPDRIPGWASHALAEMLVLGGVVRSTAEVRAPEAGDVAFLLSASDRTISNGAALDLARQWGMHGARVRVCEFPDSLRLPHDVVDPRQPKSDTAAVYPALAALATGGAPPVWVMDVSAAVRRP